MVLLARARVALSRAAWIAGSARGGGRGEAVRLAARRLAPPDAALPRGGVGGRLGASSSSSAPGRLSASRAARLPGAPPRGAGRVCGAEHLALDRRGSTRRIRATSPSPSRWIAGLVLHRRRARGSRAPDGDRRAFAVAVVACIVASPIVWPYYAALLLRPYRGHVAEVRAGLALRLRDWLLGAIAPKPTVSTSVAARRASPSRPGLWSHTEPVLWCRAAGDDRSCCRSLRGTLRGVAGVSHGGIASKASRPSYAVAGTLERASGRRTVSRLDDLRDAPPSPGGSTWTVARVAAQTGSSDAFARSAAALWVAGIVGGLDARRGGDRSPRALARGSSPTRSSIRTLRRASRQASGRRFAACRSSAGARSIRR